MVQIKHNKLRIPTGGRLTSWLFTQRRGVEFVATEDKSIQRQGGGFEPGTSGLQVQRPTTRPRSPHLVSRTDDFVNANEEIAHTHSLVGQAVQESL